MAKMQTFTLNLSDEDYAAFKACPATRLYVHTRDNCGDTRISTSNPRRLCQDLEKALDFGATSAGEVLNIPPELHL